MGATKMTEQAKVKMFEEQMKYWEMTMGDYKEQVEENDLGRKDIKKEIKMRIKALKKERKMRLKEQKKKKKVLLVKLNNAEANFAVQRQNRDSVLEVVGEES